MIDGDAFEKLSKTLDVSDPFYEETRVKLNALWKETGCLYLYTMAPVTKTVYRFIIDGSGDITDNSFSPLGTAEDVSKYDKTFFLTMGTGTTKPGGFYSNKIWGRVISTFQPIFNSKGDMVGVIGCDFEAQSIYENLLKEILIQLIIIGVLIFIATMAYISLVNGVNQQNKNLMEMHLYAEAALEAKSNFLANTSHEIRPPPNSILGMAELILRQDTSPEIYENAINIKYARVSLLVIINDILDFSKIDSGTLAITPLDYLFTDLIDDCISIIGLRSAGKQLRFITDIDGSIPRSFFGDVVRIRQVLLNLLGNAVKYTEHGYVKLAAHWENLPKQEGAEQILLVFEVSDTGRGKKEENLDKIFDDFILVGSRGNRDYRKPGLGLAISRSLCRLMGGDVCVQSHYGQGSVFTTTLPQTIRDSTPIAQVESPQSKGVLLYERRNIYQDSIAYSLANLGVPFIIISLDDLFKELEKGTWPFVFVSPQPAEQVLNIIKEKKLKTQMALLAKIENIFLLRHAHIITIPAYTAPIANILNGVPEIKSLGKSGIGFIAPEAKTLIVDDIVTNLTVAQGLLTPYQTEITTCTGGREAIELIKEKRYDIVFMDHMMPDLDGIETTETIRSMEGDYFRTLPIIALTANALAGMKEVFLDRGFSDYLSKPIEVFQLNKLMDRWIPLEKKSTPTPGAIPGHDAERTSIKIAGVDTDRGISLTGGTDAAYRKVLSFFYRDALERLPVFAGPPGTGDLQNFTIGVHALKSAAATIGADAVSKEAMELEMAGKAGDLAAIKGRIGNFYRDLKNLTEQIRLALDTPVSAGADPGKEGGAAPEALSLFLPQLTELRAVLEHENILTIDRILANLESRSFDANTTELINTVSDQILMTEFKKAAETVTQLLKAEEV
jgi:signal transduction histidine kinase/HPt (histidine-containing phosphotransfer) domain-containing protein